MTPLFEPRVQSSPNWHLIFLMPDLLWLLVGGRQTHVIGRPDFFCSVGFWWLVLYIAIVSSVSDCCVDSRVWCADYLLSLVDLGPRLASMRVY